eukprot:gene5-7_t
MLSLGQRKAVIWTLCLLSLFVHCTRCTEKKGDTHAKIQKNGKQNQLTSKDGLKLSCTTSDGQPLTLEQKNGKYQAVLTTTTTTGKIAASAPLPVVFETGHSFTTLANLPPAKRSQYLHLVPEVTGVPQKSHIYVGKKAPSLQPITKHPQRAAGPDQPPTGKPNEKASNQTPTLPTENNIRQKVNQDGRTPLHTAVYEGHLAQVENLIQKGVHVNIIDDHGHTPLHVAAYFNHITIAASLLQHQASIHAVNHNDHTPLHLAAQQGHVEMVQLLVKQDGKIDDMKDHQGRTPLHLTLYSKHENIQPIVEYFIQQGANANLPDHDGFTALHLAAMKSLAITQYLVEQGASHTLYAHLGGTPLHTAAANGCLEVVKYFIEAQKVPINLQGSRLGYTSLHCAVAYNKPEIVDYLLNQHADTELASKEEDVPLHTAINKGYVSIVMRLTAAGANLHRKNKQGLTSIDLISINGHLDYLKLIFSQPGRNINHISQEDGLTHLARATQRSDLFLVEQLVQLGSIPYLTTTLHAPLPSEGS